MERKERTFYLKDLFFSILYCWKGLLIAALVFGLLLCGLDMLGSQDTVVLKTTSMTPENQLKIQQLEANIKLNEQYITEQTRYLQESVFMQLDPYAAYTAGFHIFVQPDVPEDAVEAMLFDPTEGIMRAYRSHLNTEEMLEQVGQQVGISAYHLQELISYDTSYENCTGVTVRGRTAEEAQKVSDALQAQTEAYAETVGKEVAAHSCTYISLSTGPKLDNSLYTAQENAYKKLTTLKTAVVDAKSELSRLKPTELIPGSSSPALFAVVGVVLGMLLVTLYACIVYIAGDKVYSARTLKDRTGVTILGTFCSKKHGPVKTLLRKLEGRNPYGKTDAVAVNLRNRCGEYKNLLILGTFGSAVAEDLKNVLQKAGITCTIQADPANSAATLEQLPCCDGVVLVQTCSLSRYEQVAWQIETIESYNKPLLGCILIDG